MTKLDPLEKLLHDAMLVKKYKVQAMVYSNNYIVLAKVSIKGKAGVI